MIDGKPLVGLTARLAIWMCVLIIRHTDIATLLLVRITSRTKTLPTRIALDDLDTSTVEEGQPIHSNHSTSKKISVFRRAKWATHLRIDSLVPSSELYDRLMSYHYYRLVNINAIRTSTSFTSLHLTFKNLELTMKDSKLSGADSILVFDFLSSLVEETDIIDMNEGQLLLCPPHMSAKTAVREYRSRSS